LIRGVLHRMFCVVHFVGKTLTNVAGIQPRLAAKSQKIIGGDALDAR